MAEGRRPSLLQWRSGWRALSGLPWCSSRASSRRDTPPTVPFVGPCTRCRRVVVATKNLKKSHKVKPPGHEKLFCNNPPCSLRRGARNTKVVHQSLAKKCTRKEGEKGKERKCCFSRWGTFFYRARPLLAQRKGREMIARAREANKPREKERRKRSKRRGRKKRELNHDAKSFPSCQQIN